jgi:hypothetical protein
VIPGPTVAADAPAVAAAQPHAADTAGVPDPVTVAAGGSSGASGAPGPAPSGAVVALGLAALSLAAALVFSRLLYPPARWRPVIFVSLIERPG